MIPLQTTTVTVQLAVEDEPGEGRTLSPYLSAVPAHISDPTGSEQGAPGGGESTLQATALLDTTVTIPHTAVLTDANTGDLWEVDSSIPRFGLGLDHTVCQIHRQIGAVA